MAVSHEIQYFLGANSPTGFYSLYSELLPPETASVIYILKGGPGCGKSTLMRQVAQQAAQAGETVEYILCSADPDSLDAVVLPRLGAALVDIDATAPHVVEPKYPGAVEQYVNLGDCYDRAGLRAIRGEILTCMDGYKEHYQRAYRCLDAAAEIQTDVRAMLAAPALEERAELEELFSLPPEDRTVIHLFYYAGYSTREIAHMTRQRPGTVRSRLTRARQRLKKLLESEEDCKGGQRKGEFE